MNTFGKLLKSSMFLIFGIVLTSAVGTVAMPSTAARAQDVRFYSTLYSYEGGAFNSPRKSHTYVAFIAYDHTQGVVVDRFNISWLNQTGEISVLAGSQAGRNWPLAETQALAMNRGFQMFRLATHQINPDFFARARVQWLYLERASFDQSVLYQVMDGSSRFDQAQPAINCIHAVSNIIGTLQTGMARGRDATAMVEQYFSPYYLTPSVPFEIQQAFQNFEEGR